jgi:hypothetical protein
MLSKFEWEVLDNMSSGEYARWVAFLKMESSGTTPSGTPGGGKIGKFKNKLAKSGFYKQSGHR